MNLLALDAVTPMASVALSVDDTVVVDRRWECGRNHARELPSALASAIRDSGMKWKDLDAVLVTVGPGSFTGIRIGISLAKGISAVVECSLVGFSTLEAIAYNRVNWAGPILACVPVGADRLAYASFELLNDRWTRIDDDATTADPQSIEILPETLICGFGKHFLPASHGTVASDDSDYPSASSLVALAGMPGRLQAPLVPLLPNYLRLSSPEERMASHP